MCGGSVAKTEEREESRNGFTMFAGVNNNRQNHKNIVTRRLVCLSDCKRCKRRKNIYKRIGLHL